MIDLCVRTVFIFLALVILLRLLGKRQLGELELSELVVSILIADIASVPLQNPELPVSFGLIPCFTLFFCEFLLSWLSMKSIPVRKLFCGQPSFLIVHGKIIQKAMRSSRYTVDELAEELRNRDVNDIATVEYAILETDGTLNVLLYPEYRPVTLHDLHLTPEDSGYATVIIEDGKLIPSNLAHCGHDEKWLMQQIKRHGCEMIRQVYAMICFSDGKIYFAEKE